MVDVLSIINRVNVYHFHGDVPVLQTEGEEAYTFLNHYDDYKGTKPVLVDILNCKKGCLRGPERIHPFRILR